MKKILIITTGGTIACTDSGSGLSPRPAGSLPLDTGGADVLELFAVDSADMSLPRLRTLCEKTAEAAAKYDGIVILHGTDTLEYTAALLWHTLKPDIPVILTGSMLPAAAPDSDAPQNLATALLCAENPEFAGVYVVFAGRVIGGSEAVKRFSAEKDAFCSFSGADCGYVREGKAVLTKKSAPEKAFAFPGRDKRIAVIKLTSFTRAEELGADCDGAVIESYGAGGLPERLVPAAKALAEKVPVIMTTTCIGGARLDKYETGRRALDAGIIDGGKMSTACAAARLLCEGE